MKLRTLIVDDEPLAHDILLDYASEVPFIEVSGQCYLATDALNFLALHPVDLLFLDIQMPRIKGLDFLRTLRQPPIVVITSAYEAYALESYELSVCDYLHKPFCFDRFLKATNKVQELYQLRHLKAGQTSELNTGQKWTPKSILIKSDKRMLQLEIQDIYYLESCGNYVKVWLQDKFYLTLQTLSSFTQQLPADQFLRVHKSFIINQKHFSYFEGNRIILKNEKVLPLGKNYKLTFKQQLPSF